MKKVKGFSFNTETDKNLLDHLNNQPNQSNYIKELIRKDMQDNSIEEIIKRHIQDYLENMDIKADKKEETVSIDTDEVMNILNL